MLKAAEKVLIKGQKSKKLRLVMEEKYAIASHIVKHGFVQFRENGEMLNLQWTTIAIRVNSAHLVVSVKGVEHPLPKINAVHCQDAVDVYLTMKRLTGNKIDIVPDEHLKTLTENNKLQRRIDELVEYNDLVGQRLEELQAKFISIYNIVTKGMDNVVITTS